MGSSSQRNTKRGHPPNKGTSVEVTFLSTKRIMPPVMGESPLHLRGGHLPSEGSQWGDLTSLMQPWNEVLVGGRRGGSVPPRYRGLRRLSPWLLPGEERFTGAALSTTSVPSLFSRSAVTLCHWPRATGSVLRSTAGPVGTGVVLQGVLGDNHGCSQTRDVAWVMLGDQNDSQGPQ